MPDARVQSAIAHWAPRFVSNGVPLTDFEEVTAGVERWEAAARRLREEILEKGYDRALERFIPLAGPKGAVREDKATALIGSAESKKCALSLKMSSNTLVGSYNWFVRLTTSQSARKSRKRFLSKPFVPLFSFGRSHFPKVGPLF